MNTSVEEGILLIKLKNKDNKDIYQFSSSISKLKKYLRIIITLVLIIMNRSKMVQLKSGIEKVRRKFMMTVLKTFYPF